MKHGIFIRFKKFNKWNDYFDYKAFECKLSTIFSFIMLLLMYLLNIYDNFNSYINVFQNITLSIASALIGMIGIILGGIALIIGLLNKDLVKIIKKINNAESIERILTSFEFLTFNIGIETFIFFIIYIILNSPYNLLPKILFYLLFFLITYLFMFTLFYTVGLVSNCIKLFLITNTYNDINTNEKNLYDCVNEVRIDFILNCIFHNTPKEEFLEKLYEFVDLNNVDCKGKIINYFDNYYCNNKKK